MLVFCPARLTIQLKLSVVNGGAQKLKIAMNKEDLTQAQNFARYEPPRPATTTGTGLNGLPGGGSRPSSNTPPTGR
jgi:hypothetical protein